jgi:hypothetical protein
MSLALPCPSGLGAESSGARASGLLAALIAVTLFAIAAFSPAVLNDGDTWSHLATGEWILAHGALPRADPFRMGHATMADVERRLQRRGIR